jgi:hypothetical protein
MKKLLSSLCIADSMPRFQAFKSVWATWLPGKETWWIAAIAAKHERSGRECMFGNIEGMIEQAVSGGIDPQKIEQAASAHLGDMDGDQVAGHVQQAAQNADQAGQSQIADDLRSLVAQNGTNPQGLKDAAIAYIRDNPQVLTHFAPPFAQGILSKVL